MVDNYYSQMDSYLTPREKNRFLGGNTTGSEGGPKLSDPVVPISKLGTTFAEKPNGQQSNVLQSMLSSIRQGSSQLQLALQTPTNAVLGGGVSSMGKDQRQAIKELIKVSEIDFQGLEMPTSNMSNMSGFDPQRGGFSEQKRQQDLRSVKDAILFTAEIGAGGGIDIWSQEFQRGISDSHGKEGFTDFEGYDENVHSIKTLVDERTGQAFQFNTASLGGPNTPQISVPVWKTAKENGVGPDGVPYNSGDYLDAVGNKLVADSDNKDFIMNRVPDWDPEKKKFNSRTMNWEDFKKYAQERNDIEGKNYSPEVWYQRMQFETQFAQTRAQSLYHSQRYDEEVKEIQKLQESLTSYQKIEEGKSEQELIQMNLMLPTGGSGGLTTPEYKKRSEVIQDQINSIKQRLQHTHDSSAQADARANAIWGNIQHIKGVDEFAKNKTFDSYAEMGLFAMEQTKNHDVARDIHVGPELGWPQAYGGHTDEFIEIIEQSRNRMIKKMKEDPKYSSMYNDKQMKDLAKKHISGMLDTSHLSMWYNHFPKDKNNPHESEESRLKRFNKWYLKQMDKLGEAGVVGSIQIVDSATGDHRHLPVGQGIFPTVDAVKRLQKHGFDGAVLSEGHEEEALEPGRIQYSLWNAFGASIGTGSHHFAGNAGGNSFGNIYGGIAGAAGYRAPPNYIVGAYSPSNEWKLWSDVPLE